ncbi:MAG: polymer-forming cytoskeletal protein [Rudaea sp.]|uniref:bactofilin family protein n=1 Tax=unclassified Rudaea TaxID=2627037 RepID=UPI0010F9BCBF|nr:MULTISPECIES: polymer-forming cytoskeletal protein [unclassified Rudaea]MBN8887879.1 polymer-forming cytoskeletal protein [Rudaea sp.]
MALWKDQPKQSPSPAFAPEPVNPTRFDAPVAAPEAKTEPAPAAVQTPVRPPQRAAEKSESLIAPDIAIEGKIEGAGHVRVAGRFKGDINVHGDLSIDPRANVTGSVRAEKVVIAGELVGNIDAAQHVELTQSGALTGDLKAATLTVAAGSRMRGHAEFGWGDEKTAAAPKTANGTAS